MRTFRFLLLLLFCGFSAFSQSVRLSDKSSVSVLTCGTGNEVYSLFGHTAIRVRDSVRKLDVVYNYGAFDFSAPNFSLRFVKGDLRYFVVADNFSDFMYQYYAEKRTVSEQVLNLPLATKQRLFDELNSVLFSDERYYTYKFIDRNCTNMAADVINKTLGQRVLFKVGDKTSSYRRVLFPYFDDHFFEQLGTSIIFGTRVDNPAEKLFLPVELEQSLETASLNGQKFAAPRQMLLDFKPQPSPHSWWNNIYAFLAVLGIVIIVRNDVVALSYLVIVALIGLFFCVAGVYSYHVELQWNYNALLLNPGYLAVVVFYLQKKWLPLKYAIFFCGICTLAYLVLMINKAHLFIVIPILVTNAVLCSRMFFKLKKKLA